MTFSEFREIDLQEQLECAYEIVKELDCECEIIPYGTLTEMELQEKYFELYEAEKKGPFTPVIIVSNRGILTRIRHYKEKYGTKYYDTIVHKAESIRPMDVFSREAGNHFLEGEIVPVSMPARNELSAYLLYDREGKHRLPVILAKIPTKNPWEIAAWIPIGGFNFSPRPEEDVAVFHYWYQEYQACPVAVSHDTFELYVENIPKKEDCSKLAMQQANFDLNVFDLRSGDANELSCLAGELSCSHIWTFWWD